jgi:4-hydroxy-2-oxoheptanedioate aldolase
LPNTLITDSEVEQFIRDWFHKLDEHPALDEMRHFVADDLHINTLDIMNQPFQDWYVNAGEDTYRNQTHTVKALKIQPELNSATVEVVVRWERSEVKSPSPEARLASYAAQRWTLKRSQHARLRISSYNVDYLLPAGRVPPPISFTSHICESPVHPVIPARNSVHEAIAKNQVVFAAFLSTANLRMVEAVIRPAEVDDGKGGKILFGPVAAFIDFEHAPLTTREVEDLVIYLHAAGVAPFVRVRENNPDSFKPFLDMGALGLVIPQIGSKDDALKAWQACLYSKQRPAGVGRASEYFVRFEEYRERADDLMSVVLMVERRDAVDHIDDICQVLRPDKDMLHVGPYDLSLDLKRTQPGSADQGEAIRRIEQAAVQHHIKLAGHAPTLNRAREMFDRGYRFLTYGQPYEAGLAKSGKQFYLGELENK